jgi:cytochrome P450
LCAMALFAQPSGLQALGGLVILYIIYRVYWELTVGAARRAFIKEKGCKPVPRYPMLDPILGLDLYLKNVQHMDNHTLLETNLKRFEQMGVNTFAVKLMGSPCFLTIEPKNLQTIQALEFGKWTLGQRRYRSFIPFFGKGIFTTDGKEWAHSREMLRPNFVRSQVRDLDTFETHVSHLIKRIPRDGSTVELQELFFRLTIDSATEFLFGESTNSLMGGQADSDMEMFAEAFTRSQDTVGRRARLGAILGRLAPDAQFERDRKFVHGFVDTFVEKGLARRDVLLKAEREGKQSTRYVFLEELVKQTADAERIRAELLNILLAGRDTTASLLSNVWFTLSQRPDVWAKLREEVDSLGGARPTYEQIKEFKYLRAVLNESLRLYPVVAANFRECTEDTVLPLGGGPDGKSPMFCPKGQTVMWSLYTMHRRKDYYGEDAEEFRPERWLDTPEKKGLRPGWEYLPFNGGPRICLGQQFALAEASYTTIRLMQEFSKIESRDPGPWREWITITTSVLGCKVALTPAQ